MDKFNDFDLIWLQSTPSIAAVFYQKYLQKTHALYCPDDDDTQPTLRILSRNILRVMDCVSVSSCLLCVN